MNEENSSRAPPPNRGGERRPYRLTAPPERRTGHRAYRLALEGRLPAEALSRPLRWRLVAELHRAGLSDCQIASWTLQSSYTTSRIRQGLGLQPNRHPCAEGDQM